MCLFKRKKKVVLETKFKVGDPILFRLHKELTFGWIYRIYPNENGTLYDVQVGGQCPAVIEKVPENELTIRKE